MPDLRVVYWNVENFGRSHSGRRGSYVPLCNFIAHVMKKVDADVLCLLELLRPAIEKGYLTTLQAALHAVSAGQEGRSCHWYYDWLPGALGPEAQPPYNDFARDLAFTGQARNEGYALFWRQNLCKFTMQPADPIDAAATGLIGPTPEDPWVANRQSFGVHAPGAGELPANGIPLSAAVAVPGDGADDAMIPGPFTLPEGTMLPEGAVVFSAGGEPIAANRPTDSVFRLEAETVLPERTEIGPAGLTLNQNIHGEAPILIPGGYTVSRDLHLPKAGATIVPHHALSLVLMGRPQPDGQTAGRFTNFDPAQPKFELMQFSGANGLLREVATRRGPAPRACVPERTRRPAYCTVEVEVEDPADKRDRLIPITMYHTPYAPPPMVGMARAAMSQSLYQAYDHEAGSFINNSRAILGGDFNKRLEPGGFHYRAFTDPFGDPDQDGGGAGCHQPVADGGDANIRVNRPAPARAPRYPALGGQRLSPRHNPLNKTMVQLVSHHGRRSLPVLSSESDHYRRAAFDNVFFRGFTPRESPRQEFLILGVDPRILVEASVIDLLKALLREEPRGVRPVRVPPPGHPRDFFIDPAIVRDFQWLPVFNPPGPPRGLGPNDEIPMVLDPVALFGSIQTGQFTLPGQLVQDPDQFDGPDPPPARQTPERRAAEFIRMFVSDHLPVVFRTVL